MRGHLSTNTLHKQRKLRTKQEQIFRTFEHYKYPILRKKFTLMKNNSISAQKVKVLLWQVNVLWDVMQ